MIKFLQSGGGLPPFQYYRPVTVTTPSGSVAQPQSATASTKETKSDALTDKDVLKALDKIDGLPSDMSVLKSGLVSALGTDSSFSIFGSSDSLFGSINQIATQYADTLLGIKIANFSKKKYDDIKKTLDQNGGLNEIAVTDSGGVLVTDRDGEISQISIDTYLQNKHRYKALTNSNILYMRAYNPTYANNDALMDIASNGIGLTEINKQIKGALGSLGHDDNTKESYTVIKGVETLKEIYSKTGEIKPEGLYKIKNVSSTQKDQAKAAINYIWSMLPENSKAVLKLKSGSERDAKLLVANFVASGTTSKQDYGESYILDAEGNKPGTKKEKSENEYKPKTVSNFIRGNGKVSSFVVMNGTTDGLVVQGVTSSLTDNSGKVLGASSLATINKGGYNGVLDWNNVSMGGVPVSEAHLSELMCTDGRITSIDFPIDIAEKQKGNIVPNYEMFALKEKADREIKAANLEEKQDYDSINAIYAKYNLPAKFDASGNLITTHWARFGVMQGVALSKAFDDDQSFNDLLKEVSDNELESYLKLFNNEAHISGSNQELKGKDIEFDKPNWFEKTFNIGQHWWSTHDQMFKGTIFIPIIADEFAAMAGDDSHTKIDENERIADLQRDHDLQETTQLQGRLDE